jgi:hypothetical protein
MSGKAAPCIERNLQAMLPDFITPRLAAWMARMAALSVVQETHPPHWK